MSAPTVSDLTSLRFVSSGSPFVTLALSTAITQTLAYAWAGVPVVASTSSSPTQTAMPVVFVAM